MNTLEKPLITELQKYSVYRPSSLLTEITLFADKSMQWHHDNRQKHYMQYFRNNKLKHFKLFVK